MARIRQCAVHRILLPLGRLVYLYATLRALGGWRQAIWQVVVDGAVRSFSGYSVAVANSGVFGGGMYLVPDASLDDGLLDVVLTAAASNRSYLAALPKVFTGTHVDNADLTLLRAREVAFEADRPFAAYADGELDADRRSQRGCRRSRAVRTSRAASSMARLRSQRSRA